MLYLVVTYNASNINASATWRMDYRVNWVLWSLEMEQYWGVFAPRPPDSYWWYNIQGVLQSGTAVELFNNGALFTLDPNIPPSWDKPDPMNVAFKNHRWFKYYENGLNSHASNEVLRLNFGRWLCREYNSVHHGDDRLWKFDMWLVGDRVDMAKMDGTRLPTGRSIIWSHMCYTK